MSSTLDDRTEIETLLPFYVNGTLDSAEHAHVEAALESDDELRAQADTLRQVRANLHLTEFEQSPGEFGLARLMKDIDNQSRSPSYMPRQSALLAASVVAAAVVIGSAYFVTRSNVGYQQASGDVNVQQFAVTFQPDASQQEVSHLLLEFGLGIVEGPSAIGLYRLDPGQSDDLDGLMSKLRSRKDIVESIQLE